MTSRATRTMPSMPAIVEYWRAQDMPWLKSHYIGWDEPFCFACGWLPPAASGGWGHVGKWLDRAHLQDKFFGGPDEPFNLMPLCHLCHFDMPDSEQRETGLAWVRERPTVEWCFQVYTDERLRGVTPTRSTTLLRARARCWETGLLTAVGGDHA